MELSISCVAECLFKANSYAAGTRTYNMFIPYFISTHIFKFKCTEWLFMGSILPLPSCVSSWNQISPDLCLLWFFHHSSCLHKKEGMWTVQCSLKRLAPVYVTHFYLTSKKLWFGLFHHRTLQMYLDIYLCCWCHLPLSAPSPPPFRL